jgi:hypothetical protein
MMIINIIFGLLLVVSVWPYIEDKENRADSFKKLKLILANYSISKIVYAMITLIIVIGIIIALKELVPVLSKITWLTLFNHESANSATAVFTIEGNYLVQIMQFILLAGLFVTMPSFNAWEEKMFRLKTRSYKELVKRSIIFGLIHMIVGVDLAVAIGLMFGGLSFGLYYMYSVKKYNSYKDENTSINFFTTFMDKLLNTNINLVNTSKDVDLKDERQKSFAHLDELYGAYQSTTIHNIYNNIVLLFIFVNIIGG